MGPASVTMTDTAELLPLLRQNVQSNLSPSHLEGAKPSSLPLPSIIGTVRDGARDEKMPYAQSWRNYTIRGILDFSSAHGFGCPVFSDAAEFGMSTSNVPMPTVAELDWCSEDQRAAHGTFDYVLAADCVYHPTMAGTLPLNCNRCFLSCLGISSCVISFLQVVIYRCCKPLTIFPHPVPPLPGCFAESLLLTLRQVTGKKSTGAHRLFPDSISPLVLRDPIFHFRSIAKPL